MGEDGLPVEKKKKVSKLEVAAAVVGAVAVAGVVAEVVKEVSFSCFFDFESFSYSNSSFLPPLFRKRRRLSLFKKVEKKS